MTNLEEYKKALYIIDMNNGLLILELWQIQDITI